MFTCFRTCENDLLAMKELFRILRKKGKGIIMVPIQLNRRKSLEGLKINSIFKRITFYGQEDHVRSYSKNDFVKRLKMTGFIVQQLDKKYFGIDVFNKNGIHPRSVLYIVSKYDNI